jgi:hypothetical protein
MHNHLVMNSPKEHLKNTSLDDELDAILADSGTTDLLQKLNEHEVYLTPTLYFRRSTSGVGSFCYTFDNHHRPVFRRGRLRCSRI